MICQCVCSPEIYRKIPQDLFPEIVEKVLKSFDFKPSPVMNGCIKIQRFVVKEEIFAATVSENQGLLVVSIRMDDVPSMSQAELN